MINLRCDRLRCKAPRASFSHSCSTCVLALHIYVMDLKKKTLATFYPALLPVASMLLRAGVTWKEFADLAKTAFVEAASDRYGLRGRIANASRVSILTGLSRREVSRQRARLALPSPVVESAVGNAAKVLSGWYKDPDFLDAAGKPRELAVNGGALSFQALARRHAGDIPAGALLKELVRAHSVEQLPEGSLRVLSRSFCPQSSDPQTLLRAGEVLKDLGCNLDHNLARNGSTPPRFEGRAALDGLPPETASAFRAFVEREAQALLESADDWLTRHQQTPLESRPGGKVRVGLGIYLIENQHN